ncbi:MAG TPA: serine hydrolase [Burkholderiales bacterium]|nr:serine hydrolase [Burkholderiales bacterium]
MTTLEPIDGLDEYLSETLAAWNCPGLAVGVVHEDRLVYAKGHGYREYAEKLPFTERTIFPIASNTKLFTAIVAGLLVEEGLLSWDRPIRECVPSIRFYDDALNGSVTLRDMLAHRTGINRHDSMWFRSELTREQMFDRLRYMEPSDSLRQSFVYNNVMYAAVGHVMELVSGESWESLVQRRLLDPVGMRNTVFTMPEVYRKPEYATCYTEKRGSTELMRVPPNEHMIAAGPAGGLNSDISDMARWLTMLIGAGAIDGRQVVPQSVLAATIAPSVAIANFMLAIRGWTELLNPTYGLGRHTAVYRGRLLSYHGGLLSAMYSQVSYLPVEKLGVVVFAIGDHCGVLRDSITWNVYERLLGMDETPWNARFAAIVAKNKDAQVAARSKAASGRVAGTRPSHPIADYAGTFEHRLYPPLKIEAAGDALELRFRAFALPLEHVHYERFETPDDEIHGKWSVNFSVDPQGEVGALTMTLDEAEAVFTRSAEALSAETAAALAGVYETPGGFKCEVARRNETQLFFLEPGQLERRLVPYGRLRFRCPSFSDVLYSFSMDGDAVTAMTIKTESGEWALQRR